MRRTCCTTMVVLTLAAVLPAGAQTEARTSAPPPPTPAARPRIGYAAQPAPPPAPAPIRYAAPVYYYSPDGYVANGAPYLVLNDGSVLVNFGYGYERVLRPCAQTRGVSPSQQEATGRDALGRILPPPGIAALQQGMRGQMSGATPSRGTAACYRGDAQGRLEVATDQ